ncbi:MAG: hypothetical protein E6J39_00030 [Chloroflexi bacterium]|nr:MAG: hypothetical protein E6J39_00030 [Chloroflexota bacterium]
MTVKLDLGDRVVDVTRGHFAPVYGPMSFEPDQGSLVAAVVLAAGESRRFGSPKQLARIGDRTMLEHVLELAITAGLHPILAVVPGWLRLPTHAHEPVTWVRNPHPERGMSVSLQLGFEALNQRCPRRRSRPCSPVAVSGPSPLPRPTASRRHLSASSAATSGLSRTQLETRACAISSWRIPIG